MIPSLALLAALGLLDARAALPEMPAQAPKAFLVRELPRLAQAATPLPEGRVLREWMRLLEGFPEHAAFLKDHGLSLRIAGKDERKMGGNSFEYSFGTVYANRAVLAKVWESLSGQGASPEVLAAKSLPFIVHEIRHAITEAEIEKACGAPLSFASIEYEALSFADQAKAYSTLESKHPELAKYDAGVYDSMDKMFAEDLASGIDTLALRVSLFYKGPSVLSTPDADLLAGSAKAASAFGRDLEKVRGYKKLLAGSPSEEDRGRMQGFLNSVPYEDQISEMLGKAEGVQAFFSDPSRGEKLRAYYLSRLQALQAR
jgi:hypothetical protein